MDLASLFSLVFGAGALTGAVTYLVTRRDLGRLWSAVVALVVGIVVGASFLFVLYLAVLAFAAAVPVYLLLRRRMRVSHAIGAAATTLAGLLVASALAFWLTLVFSM